MRSRSGSIARRTVRASAAALRIGILRERRAWCGKCGEPRRCRARRNTLGERGFTVDPSDGGLDCALDLWWFFFGPVIGIDPLQVDGHEDQISPMLRGISRARRWKLIPLDQFTKACAARDHLRAENFDRQMRDTTHSALACFQRVRVSSRPGKLSPRHGIPRHHAVFAMAELDRLPGASVPFGVANEGSPSAFKCRPARSKTSWSWPSQKQSSNPRPWLTPPQQIREQTASMSLMRLFGHSGVGHAVFAESSMSLASLDSSIFLNGSQFGLRSSRRPAL